MSKRNLPRRSILDYETQKPNAENPPSVPGDDIRVLGTPPVEDRATKESRPPYDPPIKPFTPLEAIPGPAPDYQDLFLKAEEKESKPKRIRHWDLSHPTKVYRGVSKELNDRVLTLADQHELPLYEIVRYFFEYGVGRYRSGKMVFKIESKGIRKTLYPDPSMIQLTPTKKKKKKKGKAAWEAKVAYRVPVDLHQTIRSIADEVQVPTGEIVRAFLEEGLLAVAKGWLEIHPEPAFKDEPAEKG